MGMEIDFIILSLRRNAAFLMLMQESLSNITGAIIVRAAMYMKNTTAASPIVVSRMRMRRSHIDTVVIRSMAVGDRIIYHRIRCGMRAMAMRSAMWRQRHAIIARICVRIGMRMLVFGTASGTTRC
jgi:hypothetical protein